MFPTLFHFAGIRVATYGVLVAAGYLAGILWLHSHRDDMGMGEDEFWNVIYALFFGAIAGGKILYWIVEWRAFVSGELHPIRDFRYGFVFFGGFLGSVLAGILVRRRGASPFWRPADYFGVALPMGHSIGRLGCLAAGCCIGRPTDLPWGVRFTAPDSLVPDALRGVPLHPAQLYESAANALIAWGVWQVVKRVKAGALPHGSAFLAYAAAYSIARFAIEFVRGDLVRGAAAGLSTSQWIALATLAGAALAWRKLPRGKRA
jgi:phosphatidylglycerol:prolipoprotein diacylglycerol transferase